ncbi:hypothetical protein CT0861_03014 [Colletotrichum tofieldiae]|uniref:Uncharacterized protein n=1 Tax=Colletotrichum tofieldiae TaxID=708197 RepID=A0A166SR27_9PEZI|nr:hypothetical protein CT0861_03014 [Colletotrichum tofieldiae]
MAHQYCVYIYVTRYPSHLARNPPTPPALLLGPNPDPVPILVRSCGRPSGTKESICRRQKTKHCPRPREHCTAHKYPVVSSLVHCDLHLPRTETGPQSTSACSPLGTLEPALSINRSNPDLLRGSFSSRLTVDCDGRGPPSHPPSRLCPAAPFHYSQATVKSWPGRQTQAYPPKCHLTASESPPTKVPLLPW